jgi:heme exporter protein A
MRAAGLSFDRVEVVDVSRHFGRRRALAHVTLEGRAGEIVGLFGPNGAGKSTLLAILSTLMRPSTGEVRYGTRRAAEGGAALRQAIGILAHELFVYGDLTARENLQFFGRLYGLPNLAERIGQALSASRLEDRADERVSRFSRGLRQRLALERALLHDPQLVLLDEPFTGLDDASATLLRARLAALRVRGTVVFLATHDFDLAEGLIDHAWCLDGGRARAFVDGPGSLRERYRRTVGAAPP